MDLPLYTTVSRTELSDLGSIDYHLFNRAVVLDRVTPSHLTTLFVSILLLKPLQSTTLPSCVPVVNPLLFLGQFTRVLPGASKATSDDAGGLEPVICIPHGARVMLSANLWVEVGLVNGALGTVEAICYEGDQ